MLQRHKSSLNLIQTRHTKEASSFRQRVKVALKLK